MIARVMLCALVCIVLIASPMLSARANDGPLYFIGGAIGASAYGPSDANVSNLTVHSWAALQIDPMLSWLGFLAEDTARTWRFFAAFQYYQQHGDGFTVPDLDVTGYKFLFSNDLFGLPGTVLVGGGFLNDIKAQLVTEPPPGDVKSDRRGGMAELDHSRHELIDRARSEELPHRSTRAAPTRAGSESPFTFRDGLEFDIGISWPIADHVDAIGMAMFLDKGEIGTEVNLYFALGIRRPLSLFGIG